MKKYGVREICDVTFRAKTKMNVGNKVFYKNEPVILFDSLKTSTMEGAATTVYAQGGRGNSRLIAWEGERTVTFTMEDALISALSFSILSGADVIDATEDSKVIQHVTEIVEVGTDGAIEITAEKGVYIANDGGDYIYVMKLDEDGNPDSEPYIYHVAETGDKELIAGRAEGGEDYTADADAPKAGDKVLVDYYTAHETGAQQIEITADKFGGNFYVEGSTLWKGTNGKDYPAEIIIPNAKVQSNFTFTMASTGDPSTFTFTMDAFPDIPRFGTKKVLSVIQVIDDSIGGKEEIRSATDANSKN